MTRKTVARMVLISTCVMPLLVLAAMEMSSRRYTGQAVPSLKDMLKGGTQALQVTKMTGGWKYNKPTVEESQQSCTIVGSYTTAYQTFYAITTIMIRTGGTHTYDTNQPPEKYTGFEHSFQVDTNLIKNGTSYSEKFYNAANVKYGQFKGKIKDNQLQFVYQIAKGNQSSMMVETGKYVWIRDFRTQSWFKAQCRVKTMGASQVLFRAEDEVAYGEAQTRVKFSKSSGRAKLEK